MAGQGKGPLRIAIEDFLTTSTVGKFLREKLVEILEGFETVQGNYYQGFRNVIINTPGIPDSVKAVFPLATGKGHQGGILSAAGFANAVGAQAASSLLAPYCKLLNYEIDSTVHSQRLDASAAVAGFWRFPEYQKLYEGDLQDLGWTQERIEVITKLMRPRLSEGQLIALLLREKITQADFIKQMEAKGYLPEDHTKILELGQIIPQVQDLISMAVREAWNDQISAKFEYDAELPAEAAAWAAKQGLNTDWFKRYWRAHWQLISPTQGFEMMHRLRPDVSDTPFTEEDMSALLKTADYPAFFRDRLIKIAYNPYTRVDVRRMYKLGILTEADLYNSYRDLGYDDQHAKNMTAFTIKYETATETTKVEKARDLNQGTITDAYRKKIIDHAKAEELLTGLYFDAEEVKIILDAADFKAVVAAKPDYTDTLMNDLRNLVDKAYASRMLSKDEATTMLSGLHYTQDEITMLLSNADFEYQKSVLNDTLGLIGKAYVKGELSYADVVDKLGSLNITGGMQTQLFTEWQLQLDYRSDKLSEAQYRAAAIKKVITQDDYIAALQGLGYSDKNISILVQLYLTQPAAAEG